MSQVPLSFVLVTVIMFAWAEMATVQTITKEIPARRKKLVRRVDLWITVEFP